MATTIVRTRRESNYQSGLRSAVRGLWNGELSWSEAVSWMISAIDANFRRAWADGFASCGMRMEDMTLAESARLETEIGTEISYIYGFANDIYAQSKINNGKLHTLYTRLDMWTNRYIAIRDLASTYACTDQKKMWVMGYTKEHCPDCMRLHGRVYRASTWRSADLYPRKHSLKCGGFHCACAFVTTNEPCTPGFPPRI